MAGDRDKQGERATSFAELIGDVRRLQHDKVDLSGPKPPPRRRPKQIDDELLPDTFGDFEAGQEIAEYRRNGVQHSVIKKLRRGHFPIDDEVDLHGLDISQAREHLSRFLDFARGRRLACVRVVHGKGFSSPGFKPVLKPRVRHWLREDERVLAYAPAPPGDGGDGALYVLLRSRSGSS